MMLIDRHKLIFLKEVQQKQLKHIRVKPDIQLKRPGTKFPLSKLRHTNLMSGNKMFDDFIDGLFTPGTNEQGKAALTVASLVPTRDGETVVFLTCKAIYRAAKALVDEEPATQDRSQQLVRAYFKKGGVLWVFKSCAKTNNWYGRSVQMTCTDAATAPALGVEYVAQDVSRFLHRQSREETHASQVGSGTAEVQLVDPAGTKFGAFDRSARVPVPTIETRAFLFGTPYVRTTRRQLPLIRNTTIDQISAERSRGFTGERYGSGQDRVVNG